MEERLTSQRTRVPTVRGSSTYEDGAAPMKSQQYVCLSKTGKLNTNQHGGMHRGVLTRART